MTILGVVTALGALLTLSFLATEGGLAGRGAAMALTLLISGALGLIGMWLWLTNVRLLIGQGAVGYRNMFGRTRFWSGGEIDRIVSLAVSTESPRSRCARSIAFGWGGEHIMLTTSLTIFGAVVLAVTVYVLASKLLLK